MYSEKDLYVGKVLTVHQRSFELLEADEFTYQYMENNRHVYLMADWEAALKAIQAQLQGLLRHPFSKLNRRFLCRPAVPLLWQMVLAQYACSTARGAVCLFRVEP